MNTWLISKGVPWTKDDVVVHIQSCINCILEFLYENYPLLILKTDYYIQWFNDQLWSCLSKAKNVLSLEVPFPSIGPPCTDIEKTINAFLSAIDKTITKEMLSVLPDIFITLVELISLLLYIWLSFESCSNDSVLPPLNYHHVCTSIEKTQSSIMGNGNTKNMGMPASHLLNFMLKISSESKPCLSQYLLSDIDNLKTLYLLSYKLYKNAKITDANLKVLMIKLEEFKHSQHNGTSLVLNFNLCACSYAKLGKYQTSIICIRKALTFNSDEYVLPLLLNLHFCLELCGLNEESWHILKTIDQYIRGTTSLCALAAPTFIMDSMECKIRCVQTPTLLSLHQQIKVKYYMALQALRTERFDFAIVLYQEVCCYISSSTINTNIQGLFVIPFDLPTMLQIQTECMIAFAETKQYNKIIDSDAADLSFIADEYKRCVGNTPLDQDSYFKASHRLYLCVCYKLFLHLTYIPKDLVKAKANILACLQALDTVILPSDISSSASSPKTIPDICNSCLQNLKSKVLYNYALVLALLKGKTETILTFLHCALQFDSSNFKLRWDVVKLLWSVGCKVEAIQLWCDTRQWDFHMEIEKIEDLQLIRSSELLDNDKQSPSFVREDLAIINELLKIKHSSKINN